MNTGGDAVHDTVGRGIDKRLPRLAVAYGHDRSVKKRPFVQALKHGGRVHPKSSNGEQDAQSTRKVP
jgi:hypothetical protein